jgi:hypothetical protein
MDDTTSEPWRDIFARLWLLLRSRIHRHRVCEECGWLLHRVVTTGRHYAWRCEECDERARVTPLVIGGYRKVNFTLCGIPIEQLISRTSPARFRERHVSQ